MRKDFYDIVLNEFTEIAKIPRPSHHEEKICAWLMERAKEFGLSAVCDEWNNVIIDKPASPGLESAPLTILQAHTDMVCVAEEGIAFDPENDPVRIINDGKKLTADGTSLGADDGIGVAMCLYILQDETIKHGPLRVILTADEEDGMDSINMDPKYFDGKYLINLDWEDGETLCNSCAGGDFFVFETESVWETAESGAHRIDLELKDLLGGHSGVEINKGHANALTEIAQVLARLSQNDIPVRIVSFTGGQASNAIPKAAKVSFLTEEKDAMRAKALIEEEMQSFRTAFREIEGDFSFKMSGEKGGGERALSADLSGRLCRLMSVVPNNVHTMSPFIDGLVESSANLGMIFIKEETVSFQLFARSSVDFYADQIDLICRTLADAFSFRLIKSGHTPGWVVNPKSALTPLCCEEYRKLTAREMLVEPVHAGVECGAFAIKNPKLDMISIGPTLLDVHTPDECCDLASVRTSTELLVRLLETLAKQ